MARARTRLDGITAPVEIGFSIQERMNFTSSSRRRLFFSTRANECEGIDARSRVQSAAGLAAIVTGIGTKAEGQDGRRDWLPLRLPRSSKNSLTRLKKPADSGCVSSEDNFSNSASRSRWRLVKLCGVSTAT